MKQEVSKSNIFQLRANQDLEQQFLSSYLRPSVKQIHSTLSTLHPESRKRLLLSVKRIISSRLIKNERLRIATCKLLVALLPTSEQVIKKILNTFLDNSIRELQFTIFCYLDDVLLIPGVSSFRDKIPMLLEKYLNRVRTNGASSAWMAGDLLGDHWIPEQAIPVLLNVATRAKYKAGREAAIYGISKVLERVNTNTRKSLIFKLEKLETVEKGKSVKLAIQMLLKSYP